MERTDLPTVKTSVPGQCIDHDVVAVGIAKRNFSRTSVGVQGGLLFESIHECACSAHGVVEIIHPKKQQQTVPGLNLWTAQRRVLVSTPLMKAQQHRSVLACDLPEVVVRRG